MSDGTPEPAPGLPSGTARPGEQVLDHWPAPRGRGLLTTHRCLLLSHPHPLHRDVLWEVDLEAIRGIVVVEDDEGEVSDQFARVSLAGGLQFGDITGVGPLDPRFKVQVNNVVVYIGDPGPGGKIQAAIDGARASRCVALFGIVKPYGAPP